MTTVRGISDVGVRGLLAAAALVTIVYTPPAAGPLRAQGGEAGPLPSIAAIEALLPGGIAPLVIMVPAGTSAVTATAFGDTIHLASVSPQRWDGLLGVDLDQKPGTYEVSVSITGAGGARATARAPFVVKPRHYMTRKLTVGGQFVDPSPAELARIKEESARTAVIYAGVSERRWDGPFAAPVQGQATGNFGSRSVFNGQPRAPHAGIDYRGAVGTPVLAPGPGRVALAENLFFTGNTVILDHGLGLFSMYAHLSRIEVAVGQNVTGGAPLGLVGATGRVTGPHLHWAMRLGRARIDPALALQVLGR